MHRLLACALVATTLAGPADALAQATSVADATQMLASADADEIQMGIDALAQLGTAAAVGPIAARIRRGLPHEVLLAAVDALAALQRPEAGEILFALLSHRRPDVRSAAVDAIVACRPAGAGRALAAAMSDGDAQVRAGAAIALGQVGARDQLDSLFLALDRGILEAATSIGQLARQADVERLLEHLGRVPFDAMAPGLAELLAREDLPRQVQPRVISRLAELATPEVRVFFEELLLALPNDRAHRPVRDAINDALSQISQ